MKLLILPPSYARRARRGIKAIDYYDGVLYRVLRANRRECVKVLIILPDLTLADEDEEVPIGWLPSRGDRRWVSRIPEEKVVRNIQKIREILEGGEFDEVAVAAPKIIQESFKDLERELEDMGVRVTRITGQLGRMASKLKSWLLEAC